MKSNKAFVLRNIYGKYILMPICSNETSNDPILLNEVAATIWKRAACDIEFEDIIDEISKEYKLKKESAELFAVRQFVEQMVTMGLLN